WNVPVGRERCAGGLEAGHDALLLAGGSELPFDFFATAPGRELDGLVYAMTFLPQQNRRVSGEAQRPGPQISAEGKHVIVIGGGATRSGRTGPPVPQGAPAGSPPHIMP